MSKKEELKKELEEIKANVSSSIERNNKLDKYFSDNQDTIDKDILIIKKQLQVVLLEKISDWYIDKFADTNIINSIISKQEFKISEKATVELNAINKTQPLNGRKSTTVEIKYQFQFEEGLTFIDDKQQLVLENLKLSSKLRKLQ